MAIGFGKCSERDDILMQDLCLIKKSIAHLANTPNQRLKLTRFDCII